MLKIKVAILNMLLMAIQSIIYGYATVFLQEMGASDVQIGIVKGGGCILLILFSANVTGLTRKIEGLSTRKLCMILYLLIGTLLLLFVTVRFPIESLLIAYVLLLFLHLTVMPLNSNMAMEYNQSGMPVNFGFSRGMGSLAFAVTAFIAGRAVAQWNAQILMPACLGMVGMMLLTLFLLPQTGVCAEDRSNQHKASGIISFIFRHKGFVILLIGFTLSSGAKAALETYLINIVSSLGGDTVFLGTGVFCSAASEMPVMAMTPRLLKRFGSRRLLLFSAGMYVVRSLFICLAPTLPILLFGELLQGMSAGLFMAVIAYHVAETIEGKEQVLGQTCVAIFTEGLGAALGNMLGGTLVDVWGLKWLYVFCCVITILGCVIVITQSLPIKRRPK